MLNLRININTVGGLVLLNALLKTPVNTFNYAILDSKIIRRLDHIIK